MRKFILVPIIRLGQSVQGQFLEIMSEKALLGGINMNALLSAGLEKNIYKIQKLLSRLPKIQYSANLYIPGVPTNLCDTKGLDLSLLLACYIQEESCSYQKIFISGKLDSMQTNLPISTSGYFETKIKTILQSGRHPSPIPFYFSKSELDKKYICNLEELEQLNIILKPVQSFFDILIDLAIVPPSLPK